MAADQVAEVNTLAKSIVFELKKYSQGFFEVIGPAPAPMIRLKNKYRWQILIKVNTKKDPTGRNTRALIRSAIDPSLSGKKGSQSISLDIDPLDMM